MVDDIYINPPLDNPPQFNIIMSDDNLKNDIQGSALCRLFFNTDLLILED